MLGVNQNDASEILFIVFFHITSHEN